MSLGEVTLNSTIWSKICKILKRSFFNNFSQSKTNQERVDQSTYFHVHPKPKNLVILPVDELGFYLKKYPE